MSGRRPHQSLPRRRSAVRCARADPAASAGMTVYGYGRRPASSRAAPALVRATSAATADDDLSGTWSQRFTFSSASGGDRDFMGRSPSDLRLPSSGLGSLNALRYEPTSTAASLVPATGLLSRRPAIGADLAGLARPSGRRALNGGLPSWVRRGPAPGCGYGAALRPRALVRYSPGRASSGLCQGWTVVSVQHGWPPSRPPLRASPTRGVPRARWPGTWLQQCLLQRCMPTSPGRPANDHSRGDAPVRRAAMPRPRRPSRRRPACARSAAVPAFPSKRPCCRGPQRSRRRGLLSSCRPVVLRQPGVSERLR